MHTLNNDIIFAASHFDADYLEKIKSQNTHHSTYQTRESLYIKFDPLISMDNSTSGRMDDISYKYMIIELSPACTVQLYCMRLVVCNLLHRVC